MSDYYKVLGGSGQCINGGVGYWIPHEWMEVRPPLVPCRRGLHVCTIEHLLLWIGPTIWNVEIDYAGEVIYEVDKVVVSRARITTRTGWSDNVAYRFAMDCIDHVGIHMVAASNKSTEKFPLVRHVSNFARGGAHFTSSTVVPLVTECRKIACIGEQSLDYRHTSPPAGDRDYEEWDRSWRTEAAWQTQRLFEYLMHGMETPELEKFTP